MVPILVYEKIRLGLHRHRLWQRRFKLNQTVWQDPPTVQLRRLPVSRRMLTTQDSVLTVPTARCRGAGLRTKMRGLLARTSGLDIGRGRLKVNLTALQALQDLPSALFQRVAAPRSVCIAEAGALIVGRAHCKGVGLRTKMRGLPLRTPGLYIGIGRLKLNLTALQALQDSPSALLQRLVVPRSMYITQESALNRGCAHCKGVGMRMRMLNPLLETPGSHIGSGRSKLNLTALQTLQHPPSVQIQWLAVFRRMLTTEDRALTVPFARWRGVCMRKKMGDTLLRTPGSWIGVRKLRLKLTTLQASPSAQLQRLVVPRRMCMIQESDLIVPCARRTGVGLRTRRPGLRRRASR